MLPHFVGEDFRDVIAELKASGYPLDNAWFAPHFEFRFPRIGEFAYANVHVELRKAIEPWYVLGEEGAVGGTARYVDSSVERLQVKVTRHDRSAARDHVQRPQTALASHRRGRRICSRRPLSGVAAAELPASDDPGRCAAGVRRARPMDEALARRRRLITSVIRAD